MIWCHLEKFLSLFIDEIVSLSCIDLIILLGYLEELEVILFEFTAGLVFQEPLLVKIMKHLRLNIMFPLFLKIKLLLQQHLGSFSLHILLFAIFFGICLHFLKQKLCYWV